MVRYFYAWMPFVVVGTVLLLSLPWLGLVALIVFALAALAALGALAWVIVAAPYFLVRSLQHRWQERSGVERPRVVLSLAERKNA